LENNKRPVIRNLTGLQAKRYIDYRERYKLYEWIGDHSKIISQENENELLNVAGTGKIFTVSL
jgi:hypothetical protein